MNDLVPTPHGMTPEADRGARAALKQLKEDLRSRGLLSEPVEPTPPREPRREPPKPAQPSVATRIGRQWPWFLLQAGVAAAVWISDVHFQWNETGRGTAIVMVAAAFLATIMVSACLRIAIRLSATLDLGNIQHPPSEIGRTIRPPRQSGEPLKHRPRLPTGHDPRQLS